MTSAVYDRDHDDHGPSRTNLWRVGGLNVWAGIRLGNALPVIAGGRYTWEGRHRMGLLGKVLVGTDVDMNVGLGLGVGLGVGPDLGMDVGEVEAPGCDVVERPLRRPPCRQLSVTAPESGRASV